jgi:hypothetical protein
MRRGIRQFTTDSDLPDGGRLKATHPMAASDKPIRDSHKGLAIYHRLAAGDKVASAELAQLYLEPLIDWLHRRFRNLPEECETAAGEAILDLIRHPSRFQSGRGDLFRYLCMAARGDLLNLVKKERRHRSRQIAISIVEHGPHAGKYLGREHDPALEMEMGDPLRFRIPPGVIEELCESERRVWDLMLTGERRTTEYARVLNLADRPLAEQRRAVKQVKDRIKQRLKRAREKS